ncbi:MAG: tetratricopeptide repeat protein [Woeseiaceae bacterium]|nr:tetratricopeptide repeat protein [Woeseiaceae bacterium]
MRFLKERYSWLIVLGIFWLQGCASTPHDDTSSRTAGDLSSDNLDLLFATEFPVASKDEALAKATRAYRDGELDKAQFYLVRALKFDTSDTDVLAQIGNLHARQKDAVLAARAFQFALQQEPQHAASLEGMGLLYFKSGNDDEAQKHLELAIASAPNLWRSYNVLGVIADRREEFELAQSYYDAALEIQPLSDSVLINRGFSKYLVKDYQAAALDFYTVAERSDSGKAWRNLALVYARQGWYETAIETFMKAGDESYAYNETGAIAMSNGDADAALQYLTEAVRLSPTYFAQAEKNLAELRKKNTQSYSN